MYGFFGAVVQTHRVMNEYDRHFFENHTSISTILTKHQSQTNPEGESELILRKFSKLEDYVRALKIKTGGHQGPLTSLPKKLK